MRTRVSFTASKLSMSDPQKAIWPESMKPNRVEAFPVSDSQKRVACQPKWPDDSLRFARKGMILLFHKREDGEDQSRWILYR